MYKVKLTISKRIKKQIKLFTLNKKKITKKIINKNKQLSLE